jgi:hypothetical protein
MDAKVDIYQKTITYEDSKAPIEISALKGNVLVKKIEQLIYSIVHHLNNVSIGKIDIGRL